MNHSTSPSPAVAAVLLLAGVGCLSLCLSLPLLWLPSLSFPPSASPSPAAKVAAEPQKQPDGPPIVITAEDLLEAFHANLVDAKKRFVGKSLQITGTIHAIYEVQGQTNVMVPGKPDPARGRQESLVARFRDPQSLTGLRKGDRFTFIGLGSEWDGNNSHFHVKADRVVQK